MAKAGAGEASALSSHGILMPVAVTAIVLYFAGDVPAHGGGLNAEGCHHDRKRGGYHYHRGGSTSSRSSAASTKHLAPLRLALLREPRQPDAFANCINVRCWCRAGDTWRVGIWAAPGSGGG